MATTNGEIIEMRLETGGVRAVIALPSSLRPMPGQYLLGSAVDGGELLPTALFPATLPGENGDEMEFAAPLPPTWTAGMRLSLRGPLGHGFRLPAEARRVALAALGASAGALLPLAGQALDARAEVVLYTRAIPAGLPASVEVLPPEDLPGSLDWMDYLAADLPLALLPELKQLFGLRPHQFLPSTAEALIRAPMPCGGLAECGVCAVHTAAGWKLACKDGPVFVINALLRE